MAYLQKLTELTEKKIANLSPSKLALVFDGWACGSTHFLTMFASYLSTFDLVFQNRMLTVSPLSDEPRLNADGHVSFKS